MLSRALQSLAAQEYKNFEAIVINDGGVDVHDVLSNFSSLKIRYINLTSNQGLARVRNVGLKSSKGDYVAFLDDDDEFLPNHLRLCSKALKANNCDIVLSGVKCRYWKGDGYFESADFLYNMSVKKLKITNFYPIIGVALKNDKSFEFDENLPVCEDWDFLLDQIVIKNKTFTNIHAITTIYNRHANTNSLTGGSTDVFSKAINSIRKKFFYPQSNNYSAELRTQHAFIDSFNSMLNESKVSSIGSYEILLQILDRLC